MKEIYYVSNVSLKEQSGGWSGLNYQFHKLLLKKFDIRYIGSVNLKYFKYQSFISKIIRFLNYKSNYFYYSEQKLNSISKSLKINILDDNPIIFFGLTPYLKYYSKNKYFVITDISFMSYYKYYNKNEFRKSDIERIRLLERNFLRNATKVFFTSEWALKETCRFYQLAGDNFKKIGLAGNLSGKYFIKNSDSVVYLFMSKNFYKKGGKETYAAFNTIYNSDNSVSLIIIGAKPPNYIADHPGIKYVGSFNKSNPNELNLLTSHIANCSILVLPTQSDAAPLTIVECGYFGLPTIAPYRFAIPELIIDTKTGYFLPENFTIRDLIDKMVEYKDLDLIEKDKMRKRTHEYYIKNNNWGTIGANLVKNIEIELNTN